MLLRTLVLTALAAASCGRSPINTPSATTPSVPPAAAAALPVTFDRAEVARATSLDPEYVRILVYSAITNTAQPGPPRPLQLWPAGLAMHHCTGDGVPLDVVQAVGSVVAELTRIPRAETGPCTVEWVIDPTINGSGYAETLSPGHARLVFHNEESLRYAALHELCHIVGLGHSPRPSDLMYYLGKPGELALSNDERAVLRLMYGGR